MIILLYSSDRAFPKFSAKYFPYICLCPEVLGLRYVNLNYVYLQEIVQKQI